MPRCILITPVLFSLALCTSAQAADTASHVAQHPQLCGALRLLDQDLIWHKTDGALFHLKVR